MCLWGKVHITSYVQQSALLPSRRTSGDSRLKYTGITILKLCHDAH